MPARAALSSGWMREIPAEVTAGPLSHGVAGPPRLVEAAAFHGATTCSAALAVSVGTNHSACSRRKKRFDFSERRHVIGDR